jgi:hypothetical protein
MTDYAQRDDDDHYMVDRVARTTAFEVPNDGSPGLFELRDAVVEGTADLNLIGQSLNFYDGEAFEGLPFGQLGDFGAVSRGESGADRTILEEVYHPTVCPPALSRPERPPACTADIRSSFGTSRPTWPATASTMGATACTNRVIMWRHLKPSTFKCR